MKQLLIQLKAHIQIDESALYNLCFTIVAQCKGLKKNMLKRKSWKIPFYV